MKRKDKTLESDIRVLTYERLSQSGAIAATNQMLKELAQTIGVKQGGKKILDPRIEERLRRTGVDFMALSDNVGVRVFAKVLDAATQAFKTGATIFSPAFTFRNKGSDTFFQFLADGAHAFDPRNATDMLGIMRGSVGAVKTVFGDERPYAEVRELLNRSGAARGYYHHETGRLPQAAIRDYGAATLPWKQRAAYYAKKTVLAPHDAARAIAGAVEDSSRIQLIVSGIRQGLSDADAVKRAESFHFDYGNLSDFEKYIMKRIVPFYTFTRKSTERVVQSLIEKPRSFTGLNHFASFLNSEGMSPEEFAQLPYYVRQKATIRMRDGSIITGLELGFEDAINTFLEPLTGNFHGVLSKITPYICTA
jgi:hypothetical protein